MGVMKTNLIVCHSYKTDIHGKKITTHLNIHGFVIFSISLIYMHMSVFAQENASVPEYVVQDF